MKSSIARFEISLCSQAQNLINAAAATSTKSCEHIASEPDRSVKGPERDIALVLSPDDEVIDSTLKRANSRRVDASENFTFKRLRSNGPNLDEAFCTKSREGAVNSLAERAVNAANEISDWRREIDSLVPLRSGCEDAFSSPTIIQPCEQAVKSAGGSSEKATSISSQEISLAENHHQRK